MKKRIYVLLAGIFILAIGISVSAQTLNFELAGSFGSKGADEPRYAITDTEGNYYVVGYGAGDIILSPDFTLTGKGGNDALVIKYNADMELQWARYVGGTGSESFESVAVNSAGDVYAVGRMASDCVIDGTSVTISKTNAQDGLILVFDKDGNYKSHKTLAGTGNTSCYSIVIDREDNIHLGGTTVGTTDFGNGRSLTPEGSNGVIFLAKYNQEFICQWVIDGNCNGNLSDVPMSVNLDRDQNILLAGRFLNGSINIKGTDEVTVVNTKSASGYGFVTKITPSGNCLWIKAVTCAGNRIDMKGIAADSKGNIGVMGFSNNKITPEGGSEYTFGGNMDNFFVKYSPSGEYIDGFALGGVGRDEGKSLFIDNEDNIYLAGNMNGVAAGTIVDMNPKGAIPVNKTFYGHDGYFAKYNGETLELMQVEKTTSPANSTPHEVAFNVTMSADFSTIYVLGYFNNSNTIFDGEGGSCLLPNAGGYDFYWTTYRKTFSLTDGVEFENPVIAENVNVNFRRIDLIAGQLSSICLPFETTISGEDAVIYQFDGTQGDVANFSRVNDGRLMANTPYLFKPMADKLEINERKIKMEVTAGNKAVAGAGTDDNLYLLKGTYQNTIAIPEITYGIYQDKFVKAGNNVTIPAFRAFLEVNTGYAGAKTLRINHEAGVTGMESPVSDNEISIFTVDREIHIMSSKNQYVNVYTIEGKLVRSEFVGTGIYSINGLPKGLYIVNNQKVNLK